MNTESVPPDESTDPVAIRDHAAPAGSPVSANNWIGWLSLVVSAIVILWFYAVVPRYGGLSAFGWLGSAWNSETDYEHGPLFPLIIIGLLIYQFKSIRASVGEPCMWGLLVLFVGILCYWIGFRTMQPRITLGALPHIIWGSVLYLWGWRTAKKLIFPVYFFWLAVPLPSFQQATVHLQLLATHLADMGAGILGVDTVVQGTAISSADGDWAPVEIAKGCSGIRSLMALIMISAVWAYVANVGIWKKLILFGSALPLAILGNGLRVTSILVIAKYGNQEWATGTWHDWSGLLLFYPFTLMLLLIIHSLLEGGLPWVKGGNRRV
ncbi:MAG TPA: exosortase/archaeosortase family protein, partial [Candidatus Obscuribacterales bacterium]